jgi:hypothetical protein
MHASAFERRLGLDESLNGSNGHFGLLDAKIYPVVSGGAKFTVHLIAHPFVPAMEVATSRAAGQRCRSKFAG